MIAAQFDNASNCVFFFLIHFCSVVLYFLPLDNTIKTSTVFFSRHLLIHFLHVSHFLLISFTILALVAI